MPEHKHGININAISRAISPEVGTSQTHLNSKLCDMCNSNGTVNKLSELEKAKAREQVLAQKSRYLEKIEWVLSLLK